MMFVGEERLWTASKLDVRVNAFCTSVVAE